MKMVKWLAVVYLAVIVVNFLGCEYPHEHHTEIINEHVVEQQEVVE